MNLRDPEPETRIFDRISRKNSSFPAVFSLFSRESRSKTAEIGVKTAEIGVKTRESRPETREKRAKTAEIRVKTRENRPKTAEIGVKTAVFDTKKWICSKPFPINPLFTSLRVRRGRKEKESCKIAAAYA
ncbi:MAG TPA: hypothetical protein VJL58_00060 [Pyrinomonadaceae bacterium]|nr:hypothetical protein [Pyrinomonadaceae bacterium]